MRIIETNGYKPSVKSLEIKKEKATEEQASVLAIEPGDDLLSLTRLFYADDQPVILARNVIPVGLFREPLEQIDGQLHIREIINRYCHQDIAFTITEIRSVLVEDKIHDLLGKARNRSVLALNISFFSKQSLPLALGANYLDDEVLRLSLVQAWS